MQHRGDNTYFLLVACRVVADKFLLSDHFSIHKAVELTNPFIYFIFFQTIHFPYEMEIFFGSEIINQKTVIDKCSGHVFPFFTLAHIEIADAYASAVCFQQVQYQSEQGCFSGTVVAYQAQHVTALDGIVFYICGYFRSEVLF